MLKILSRMLGAELKPVAGGYAATIKGKRYLFPSLTRAYDAARHGLAEYQVR